MQSFSLLLIFPAAAILIWLGILTFFIAKFLINQKKYVQLEKENLERNLIASLSSRLKTLEDKELNHIQKVKILRFNPFKETGGDTSFTLSLLNAKMDGLILTGLNARDKMRLYAKEIKKGKSSYELSEEEQKVIKD